MWSPPLTLTPNLAAPLAPFCAAVDSEAASRERHQPAAEVEGATMTGLCVRGVEPGLWQEQCVVDVRCWSMMMSRPGASLIAVAAEG